MNEVVLMTSRQLRADHVEVWHHLFASGLSISTSKATGAINGDRINSTLYMTLSQVHARSVLSFFCFYFLLYLLTCLIMCLINKE